MLAWFCWVLSKKFTSQSDRAGGAVPAGGLRLRHKHVRVAYQGHRQGLQAASERGGHALLLPCPDDALARGETRAKGF